MKYKYQLIPKKAEKGKGKRRTDEANSKIVARFKPNCINNHIKCKYLNIPIKRQRFSDWIKKRTRSNYMKLTRKLLET